MPGIARMIHCLADTDSSLEKRQQRRASIKINNDAENALVV